MDELKTMFNKIFFLILFVLYPAAIFASPCSNYDKDRAQHFADIAGNKIVSEYGGGRNIRVSLYNCDNNTYNNEYRLQIGISWNGVIVSDNYYSSEGVLKLKSNGARSSYSETYANQNLKDWKSTRFWIGGAIVLGALASENSNNIYVTNDCSYDIRMFIRFKDFSGSWVNKGWYRIASGKKKTRLVSNDVPIKTRNRYVYIFAEDTKGRPRFGGKHKIYFSGKDYKTQELHVRSIPVSIVFCK